MWFFAPGLATVGRAFRRDGLDSWPIRENGDLTRLVDRSAELSRVSIGASIMGENSEKFSLLACPPALAGSILALVSATPYDASAPPRRQNSRTRDRAVLRHRSRQRERILNFLRESSSHPTATQIHGALLSEIPSLSLATVYRNLDVLVEDGEIDEVASGFGAARYDGNLVPHHHFHCEACNEILDIVMPVPRGLTKKLVEQNGLAAERVQISFYGICPTCDNQTAITKLP